MLPLIALSVFAAVAAFSYSISTRHESIDLQQRIAGRALNPQGRRMGQEEPAPSSMAQMVFGLTRKFLPSEILDKIQASLVRAGSPTSLQTMVLIWIVGIVVLPVLYAVLVFSRGTHIGTLQIVSLVIFPILGFYIPNVWLKGKIAKRKKLILKSLPDGIDLITTSVEAGLGIDAAFARVAEKVHGPLAAEFRRCLREMSLGRTRRESLADFAERTQLEDVNLFVNAVIQAEQTGVSLGQVIRIQAEQMRMRRKQRAEQAAYKAPVKMVIPLVIFIFPAMFIVILGPAVLEIFK